MIPSFHKAFKSNYREILARITINDIVYENDNLTSFEYEGGSISGETFSIGSTFSNSVKITFCEIIEGLQELDEVKVEIGIKFMRKCSWCETGTGDKAACKCKCESECDCKDDCKCEYETIEYCPMGTFLISEAMDINRNENKTTIDCLDRMILLEGSYESQLTYPAAIQDVALEIANLAGVEINSDSFASLSAIKIAKPEGYTYRQALGLIAQFEVGFVTFDRGGLLCIRTLNNTEFEVSADEYFLKGLVKNELMYRLSGVQATVQTASSDEETETTLQAGSTSGAQITLENNVMTQSLLEDIYGKLEGLNYYPFTLNWRGNPALETGDWIVILDKDGNRFKAPNLGYKLNFNGGLTAESSAETTTQSGVLYQSKGTLTQSIEQLNNTVRNSSGNANFYDTDNPKLPKLGDLLFKTEESYAEIWIYKKIAGVEEWKLEHRVATYQALVTALEKIVQVNTLALELKSSLDIQNSQIEQLGSLTIEIKSSLETQGSQITQLNSTVQSLTITTQEQGVAIESLKLENQSLSGRLLAIEEQLQLN